MPIDLAMRPALDLTGTSSSRPDSVLIGIAERSRTATDDGGAILCWFVGGRLYVDSVMVAPPQYAWPVRPEPARAIDSPHANALRRIKEATGLSDESIAALVGVTRQSLSNWDRGGTISGPNRRRLLNVLSVIEEAARLHQTPDELAAWLDTPRGAEAVTPARAIKQEDWNKARYLAAAVPPRTLVRPPSWVKRRTPARFVTGAEHRQEPYAGEDPLAVAQSEERD